MFAYSNLFFNLNQIKNSPLAWKKGGKETVKINVLEATHLQRMTSLKYIYIYI